MEELSAHIGRLLSQMQYKILVNGNLRTDVSVPLQDPSEIVLIIAQQAVVIADMVETILAAEPLPKSKAVYELSRILPEGAVSFPSITLCY